MVPSPSAEQFDEPAFAQEMAEGAVEENAVDNLSLQHHSNQETTEAGTLKNVVSELDSSNAEVQSNALAVLAGMTLDIKNTADVLELQAVPKITSLLDSNDLQIQKGVAEAFWNLGGADEIRFEILSSGGVKKLMDLLPYDDPGSPSPVGRSHIVSYVLGALANLSLHPEVQTAIREGDGIGKVIDLLTKSSDTRVRERAANCMENLALDRENRISICAHGGVAGLLRLASSSNEAGVRASAGALKNLAVDEDCVTEILKEEGLPICVRLLRQNDLRTAGKVAECIGNFALVGVHRIRVQQLGGVSFLLRLLADGIPDDVQLACVGALLNLAVDYGCKTEIIESGGVPKLVSLLEPTFNAPLRIAVAITLTNLSVQEEGVDAIFDAGGVPALVQCINSPTHDLLQEKAANVLCNIAATPSMKQVVLQAGGIPVLVSLIAYSTYVPSVENCLSALLALAELQVNREAMVQANIVSHLISLLGSGQSPVVVERAAGVIWNLAHDREAQLQVRQEGGLGVLVDLLKQDSPPIRFNVVGALPLLIEEEGAQEVFDHGALGCLTEILAFDSNLLNLQNTAQTLGHILEGHPVHQKAAHDLKVGPHLLYVIDRWAPPSELSLEHTKAPDWVARQNLLAKCCFTVWALCQENDANKTTFREVGGMFSLTKLLHPLNEDMLLEMVTAAICALCQDCEENKDAFRECQGLEPAVGLLDHVCVGVCMNVAKALCHISENEENRKKIHELGGLTKLAKLLTTETLA